MRGKAAVKFGAGAEGVGPGVSLKDALAQASADGDGNEESMC